MHIINEVGVDKLTMRAVAARLDVSAMALYHHVEDKDELLRLVGDDILGGLELPDPDSGEWRSSYFGVHGSHRRVTRSPGLSSVLLTGRCCPTHDGWFTSASVSSSVPGWIATSAQEVYAGVQTLALGAAVDRGERDLQPSSTPHPDDEIHDYTLRLRGRDSYLRALTTLVDGATSA